MVHNSLTHVASFEKLLGICNNLGARYNPGNAAIMPPALGALHDQAQKVSKAVTNAQTAYTLAVNSRKEVFDALPSFVAKLVRSAMGHQVSAENMRDLKLLKKKFYSSGTHKKPPALTGETEDQKKETKSGLRYRTFDTKAAHFADIVSIIESLPDFKPNEAEFSIEMLIAKQTDLNVKSAAVTKAFNELIAVKMKRDEIFYGISGISPISMVVKDYIRSATGIQSEVSRAIGKIQISNKKVK